MSPSAHISFMTSLALVLAAGLTSPVRAAGPDLALVGAKVYPSPQGPALEDAVVLVHDGRITRIGKRGQVRVPRSAQVLDVTGKVVTAGFWNSHVHFIEPAWSDAATAPASRLADHMQEMLTRWGFTTVFDVASFLRNTTALRTRVEKGEVPGPRIYTTGEPLFPLHGIPSYVGEEWNIPQAATPEDARRMARQRLADGADGIKVFAGSITQGGVIPMDPKIIRSAVEVAHAAGRPVFAHPSNRVGLDNALAGGVDVLAHTAPMAREYSAEELAGMKQRQVALIPTLALFPDEERKSGGSKEDEEAVIRISAGELQSYFAAGGTVLFGTDVGYTQLYDTTTEFDLMARAGMSWRDILASLTTHPSRFFKANGSGRVEPGQAADLVVLDADPAADVRNFAKVAWTIRGGKVIFRK